MKRLQNHLVGVDQGEILLFSDFEEGGPMWLGSGPRSVVRTVTFSARFHEPPTVMPTVAMWDIDQSSNQRGDISARNVTERGFDLVFKTWGDTRVARVRAAWMAIGALAHDDDWPID